MFSQARLPAGLTLRTAVNARKINAMCDRERLSEDFRPACHEDFAHATHGRTFICDAKGLLERRSGKHAVLACKRKRLRLSAYDDGVAPVERLSDGLKRFAAHDQRMAQRQPPEAPKIAAKAPGQPPRFSDYAVIGDGNDD